MARPAPERVNFPIVPRDQQALRGWASSLVARLADLITELGTRANASISDDGDKRMAAPLPLQSVKAADLPPAADWEGSIIYVSDGASGAKFRGSDGSSWVNLG